MKNSTSVASSKANLTPERVLAGLIFFPSKRPDNFFPSLHAWVEGGRVSPAYIYDSADTLLAAGIKIIDAREVRGVWYRLPKLLKPTAVRLRVHRSFLVPVTPGVSLKTIKGIQTSDTKAHHKMSY